MEIIDKKFDSNRNLYVIYDPHTEFQGTNSFSFYHDVKYNKGWITIDIGKDNNQVSH